MSYSYAVEETGKSSSVPRVATAALLAVTAGACAGLAFAPSVSSLHVAPVSSQTVTSSGVVTPASAYAPVLSASSVPQESEYLAAPSQPEINFSTVSSKTVLASGFCAAFGALVAYAFSPSRSESQEKLALAAVFSRKGAAAPAKAKAVSNPDRPLWYPTATPPDYLDGSMPGDRGFDPLGLSKPAEYVQFDFDELDQNAAKNRFGTAVGVVRPEVDQVSTNALQPYSEVFGIKRLRECELIHARWAMMAVLGILVSEAVTGVAWQDAGLVESVNRTYWGFDLPFTGTQIVWIEVLSMGFVEVFRNTELNIEKRCYPGGAFDPLGLTTKDEATTFRLKEAELKHGRLAMLAFLGFAVAAGKTGLGATMAFNAFANFFN